MTDTLYEIEGLAVDYASPRAGLRGRGGEPGGEAGPALEIASLRLAERGITALVGPNGSGKTTLLKALNGLVKPRAGRILFRGEELSFGTPSGAGLARLRAETVYLHQSPYIMAGSVSYNVAYGALVRGLSRAEASKRAALAMEALGLDGFEGRGHRALSGGEAQRVGLARALATGAKVFLLDEPTASVDTASRGLVIEAILRLSEGGATVLLSTHDPALAGLLRARVVELDSGRITGDRSFQ